MCVVFERAFRAWLPAEVKVCVGCLSTCLSDDDEENTGFIDRSC